MKYLLLLLLLFGCDLNSKYQKNDCVILLFTRFYHRDCQGSIVRVDVNYSHKKYLGTLESKYVDKGCPERYNFQENQVIEKVTCPKSLSF